MACQGCVSCVHFVPSNCEQNQSLSGGKEDSIVKEAMERLHQAKLSHSLSQSVAIQVVNVIFCFVHFCGLQRPAQLTLQGCYMLSIG